MIRIPSIKDSWEQILARAGIAPEDIGFVSDHIGPEIIREFVEPRLVIPIYSAETYSSRFPFLSKHGLTPLRTGIGTAVLTRANLFLPIIEKADSQLFMECNRDSIPLSLLDVPVNTEAKYLALAYESGVFNTAFSLPVDVRAAIGLFGKMNLPKAKILLADDQGKQYPLHISNVQFDLDFSLETQDCIYLIEAKRGNAKTFSALQLFYPYALFMQINPPLMKTLRTFLLQIDKKTDSRIQYMFHEYSFRIPLVANSSILKQVISVDLKISKNSLETQITQY